MVVRMMDHGLMESKREKESILIKRAFRARALGAKENARNGSTERFIPFIAPPW